MDCTKNSREHDEIVPVRAEGATAGVGTTLGLLPILAVAMSGSAFAQSSVSVDEITVGGGGTPAPAAAPAEDYEVEPAPAAPTDLSLRDGGAGVLNPGVSSSARSTAPLLNTPQTVTVIPGTLIQQRQATTMVEALRNTPGITFDAGENGFASGPNQFNIRGFNSVGSLFIDDTRDNGSFTRDTFNIEGIEIVKGPAADNGRGTAGGYINTVTKTPRIGNFVAGTAGIGFDEYDSEMRRRATLDVNQGVGTVGVRLNAMIQDGGVAGRDIAENDAWGVAPSLAFGLGTNFRATFAYEHYERNDVPDMGLRVNGAPSALRSVRIPGAGARPNGAGDAPRDFAYPQTALGFDDTVQDAFLARFEYDIVPGVTISNQTRWAEVDRDARTFYVNGAAIPGVPFEYSRNNETLSNQTNLRAKFNTGPFKHTLSTGVDLSREESFAIRPPTTAAQVEQLADVQIDTVAFYAFNTVELSRHWQLTGGVRVEHYDLDLSGQAISGVPGAGILNWSDSDTTVGGKIGLAYKPVDNGTFYASYGLSHLPHGSLLSNPDIARNGVNAFSGFVPGADPVELHNYEVGVKWDWFNGKLSTTAALFHTEKKKVGYPVPGSGSPPDVVYGRQVVQGLELGIAGEITERWKVYGGLLWMDSERKHGPAVDAALNTDYGAGLIPAVTTTNGDELAYTPNFSATLWMTYDLTDKFTFGGGIQYVGDSWVGRPDDALRVIPNGKFGKVPDYFLVNLYASYDITDNIELSLNVDNVFDEEYVQTLNWNGNWGYLGAPRTYWLSANFKY
ncbi:TonB-dependent receptor [Hyphomicrobium sp.]|uniref:TonB-dependent receptor n=1 Tax=Hyphomicrobium sp. TaxID=82 RepID=UPI002C34B536|nr:TonB-dependent receptor [Hyphomicrobium sp.]HRN87106.1 TonB-dependent receptor [Hyphomicrobium sp.]HRQ25485.1 TonB-dependent receptor [Hyphomicrobium sp.]